MKMMSKMTAKIGRDVTITLGGKAGRVLNNANANSMMGPVPNITIEQHNQFTTDVTSTIRAEIKNVAPIIADAAVMKMRNEVRRRGFNRFFG